MGHRGPAPKPTVIRKLEGNRSKRPLPENEPEPDAVKAIAAPLHLSDLAAEVYVQTAAIMRSYDLLTVADLQPLELFADSYSQWIEAVQNRNELKAEGEDYSGAAKMCRELASDCNRWFKVLGLGPAYRVGLVTNFGLGGGADISDPVALKICGS
ncbi:MAG TPA: hypothetical protein DDW52_24115 [Planctomycetaceae bacterium]|nr:hypothetical protein [Planctomycetaceae bacterium]